MALSQLQFARFSLVQLFLGVIRRKQAEVAVQLAHVPAAPTTSRSRAPHTAQTEGGNHQPLPCFCTTRTRSPTLKARWPSAPQ